MVAHLNKTLLKSDVVSHISEMAEPRIVKFCIQVSFVKC